MVKNRLPSGGLLDRSQFIDFTYDGKKLKGFAGDSLASALLANNVWLVNRSFKYHRPRGIFSCGEEEPNALVQLEKGAYATPNSPATTQMLYDNLYATSQNCFPSARFDLGAINSLFGHLLPSGFYYKTFMWPASAWKFYEYFIRKMAGLGKASGVADPDIYESEYAHPDILIVGGGIAGVATALTAVGSDAKVTLIEQDYEFGGGLIGVNHMQINGEPLGLWLRHALDILNKAPNITVLPRTVLFGYYNHNYLTATEKLNHHLPPDDSAHHGLLRERLWHFRPRHVILANGAIERPFVYGNNDLPGTMLASALGEYMRRYAVLPGKNILFAVNNDHAYYDAIDAQKNGANVTICDARDVANHPLAKLAREKGIRTFDKTVITEAVGKKHVQGAYLASIDNNGTMLSSDTALYKFDMIALSAGFTPSVHLHAQARGSLKFDAEIGAFVPDQNAPMQSHSSIGACNGTFDMQKTLDDATKTMQATLRNLGLQQAKTENYKTDFATILPMRPLYETPHHNPHKIKSFVDLQNDSTANDLRLAMREGMESVEHAKRYTTTGMATDQGKTSNINAMGIIAANQNKTIPDIGYTTYRQPYIPVTFGAIAGARRDKLFLPARYTPMHRAHERLNAEFEPVGDWMRAWYYKNRKSDQMENALKRETMAVRQSVGMFDASTLGKIDLQGADALWLLNMLYTNAWDNLSIGRCRYGVMLNEHGMIFDDGVTTRLGENHYHMTTTTGGAARVMDWIELWLQTEWPDKKVYASSVTEQWAVVAIAGPKARHVLTKLTDSNIDNEALPFMSMLEAKVAGIDARIFRITFSGELCFEINVPARYGLALWQAITEAGQEFNITPYGTETMHVLRAEKGFIIVGQDTDGSCTPYDMNLGWLISKKKKDFLGKRSLSRSDSAKDGRKQFVGLVAKNKTTIIPEGLQITASKVSRPPYKMIGHVTSSYYSHALKQGIALAMVKDGLNRIGEQVYLPRTNGGTITATITDSVFYDKDGNNARS
ncbi:MAG: sarcosine oxidase subunit alpha family protein [Alphaproteobacteria bacterium]|nr:sarcosine oxidase subunit alpha family protein [Alphaproteobacteria bacterium]